MRRLVGGLVAALSALALIAPASAGPRSAPLEGEGEGLKLIANIAYVGGTDMELATIGGRDYAFAASEPVTSELSDGAVRVIDVTKPETPRLVATLACSLTQADVQISHDKKTLIVAADATGTDKSCLAAFKTGFMTVDISNPLKPKPVGFAQIPDGSHNTTAHPTKPYVYNSYGSGRLEGREIQIWSIKDPAKPKLVSTVISAPYSTHDIGFNKDGSMAVTAARTHFDLFDTSDPEAPVLLFKGQCPGCTITHDAQFAPDGKHIFIGDELNGGQPAPCPGGALYAYELQGPADRPIPVLVGAYEPDEVRNAQRDDPGTPTFDGGCTSHVFDISADSSTLAIAWYTAGVRYLDISDPRGIAVGSDGAGMTELGWFIPTDADTWSAKFHKGPYIFANDLNRGFDVYKVPG